MRSSCASFGVLLSCCLFLAFGCAQQPPAKPGYTLSEAHKKLVQICKEEYRLDIVLLPAKDTLWIYLASQESFLELKVGETPAPPPQQSAARHGKSLNFLDAKFSGRDLLLSYDIGKSKNYPADDPGYSYNSPEQFQKNLQNLPSAVVRVFGETAPEEQPKFVIMVFADIKSGLEYQMFCYFPDLLRANSDPTFAEEYRQRVIVEGPKGNPAIIADTTGRHLAAGELSWQDFLLKQMLFRIRFKYQQSSVPPKANDVEEILAQVYATVSAYPFTEFDGVKLIDLGNDKTYDFRKEQLATFSR